MSIVGSVFLPLLFFCFTNKKKTPRLTRRIFTPIGKVDLPDAVNTIKWKKIGGNQTIVPNQKYATKEVIRYVLQKSSSSWVRNSSKTVPSHNQASIRANARFVQVKPPRIRSTSFFITSFQRILGLLKGVSPTGFCSIPARCNGFWFPRACPVHRKVLLITFNTSEPLYNASNSIFFHRLHFPVV